MTGFVGGARNCPAPISEDEVMKIVNQMQEGVEKPRHKVEFEAGEYIRVKDGPFTDFNGTVEEVNYEKSKLRVRSRSSVGARRWSSNSARSKRRPDYVFIASGAFDSVPAVFFPESTTRGA